MVNDKVKVNTSYLQGLADRASGIKTKESDGLLNNNRIRNSLMKTLSQKNDISKWVNIIYVCGL
jgi:hypothetical protein